MVCWTTTMRGRLAGHSSSWRACVRRQLILRRRVRAWSSFPRWWRWKTCAARRTAWVLPWPRWMAMPVIARTRRAPLRRRAAHSACWLAQCLLCRCFCFPWPMISLYCRWLSGTRRGLRCCWADWPARFNFMWAGRTILQRSSLCVMAQPTWMC